MSGVGSVNRMHVKSKRMLIQKEFEPIDLPFKTLFIRLLWASERFQKNLLRTEVIFSTQKSFFWYGTERLRKCLLHNEIIKIEVPQPNTGQGSRCKNVLLPYLQLDLKNIGEHVGLIVQSCTYYKPNRKKFPRS